MPLCGVLTTCTCVPLCVSVEIVHLHYVKELKSTYIPRKRFHVNIALVTVAAAAVCYQLLFFFVGLYFTQEVC